MSSATGVRGVVSTQPATPGAPATTDAAPVLSATYRTTWLLGSATNAPAPAASRHNPAGALKDDASPLPPFTSSGVPVPERVDTAPVAPLTTRMRWFPRSDTIRSPLGANAMPVATPAPQLNRAIALLPSAKPGTPLPARMDTRQGGGAAEGEAGAVWEGVGERVACGVKDGDLPDVGLPLGVALGEGDAHTRVRIAPPPPITAFSEKYTTPADDTPKPLGLYRVKLPYTGPSGDIKNELFPRTVEVEPETGSTARIWLQKVAAPHGVVTKTRGTEGSHTTFQAVASCASAPTGASTAPVPPLPASVVTMLLARLTARNRLLPASPTYKVPSPGDS